MKRQDGKPKKAVPKRDRNEIIEDLFRPNRCLGYDRDALAMYLVEREAYSIAESQFERAIWVNPYEASFKRHLAWCLYKQGRYDQAEEWAMRASEQSPSEDCQQLLELIQSERRRTQGANDQRKEAQ